MKRASVPSTVEFRRIEKTHGRGTKLPRSGWGPPSKGFDLVDLALEVGIAQDSITNWAAWIADLRVRNGG
jgi:hypothetical protein